MLIEYPLLVIAYLYIMIKNALGFSDELKESSSENSSIIEREPNVMYFDFETTGLNPFHDKIIEYAF